MSNHLQRIAARTGTSLSSLALSFGILHELTAAVPLAAVFFGARAAGAGESAVDALRRHPYGAWIGDGEAWAARVTRRYYKEPRAADVANAVLAYGVVKATLPLRIGLSLWLAPRFSRACIDPIRSRLASLCKSSL